MKTRLLALAVIIPAFVTTAPALAIAQHPPHGHGHRHVVVHGYAGYPFYGPYWGWGWGFGYPSPFYPYAPYGYYLPPDDSSAVRLQVTPRETEVFVDGALAGTVDDFDGVFQRIRLEPGEHEIVLYLKGHRSLSQKVNLARGADVRLRHAMVPLAPGEPDEPRPVPAAAPPQLTSAPPPGYLPRAAERFGTLALRVQPAGAEVFIDGDRWQGPEGFDRLEVMVAEGLHRVEVRKDGFAPFSTELAVRQGDTTALNISLPKQ